MVVGAELQLAVLFSGEHEGPAFGLPIPAHGSQILDRVLGQEFYDFVHDELSPKCCCVDWFSQGVVSFNDCIVPAIPKPVKYAQFCGIGTCR